MRINEAVWLEKYSRWQIKVQKEGIRKTFSSYTEGKKGKREAEKKADEWLRSDYIDISIRFDKAYEMFYEEKKLLTNVDNAAKVKSQGKNWILPELGHKKVANITPAHIQNIINNAYRAGLAKRTLEGIKGTIGTFHTFCRKNGWKFCGVEFVQIPKGAKKGKRTILQPEQIQAIFNDNTKELYIHAFRFLVLTGLRRGELCALMNSDIVGSIAYIQRSINKRNIMTDGKTENAQRAVALCKRAMEVLSDQKKMLKKRGIISPYVFPNITGEMSSPNNFYEHWHDYRQTLDINCSLHELRHTLISYASANIPETLLKKTAGHSKSMDTGIYIHAVQDESAIIASLLDERFKSIL